MAAEPTIVVKLGKEAAEYILSELGGVIHGIARDLAADPNIDQDMARLSLDKLLAIVGTIEDAATRAGVVLERIETRPDTKRGSA